MPLRPHHRLYLASASLVALAGCGNMLPDVALLDAVRPLAARIEVTAPLVPDEDPDLPSRAQALPFETVTITPLVAGPQGVVDVDTLAPLWFACPLSPAQSLYGCISSAFPTALDELPECEIPDPGFDLDFSEIPPAQGLCRLSTAANAELTIPFDLNILSGGGVEVTMIAGVPGGTSTETCADVLLSGDIEVPDDCVLMLQRVTVGPLEQLFALAAGFGAEIPPEFLPEDPESLPDFDRNTEIEEIGVFRLPELGAQPDTPLESIPPGGAVQASYGDALRFAGLASAFSLQTFDVESANGEVREESEAYQGAWYRTWGRLQSPSSNDAVSFNEYEVVEGSQDELELPEGDVVQFIYVLRDGRSGVDWRTWTLEASSPP